MEIVRSLRDGPPTHYSIKIKSFSSFLRTKTEKYESGLFEAGQQKWRLRLYPNGRVPGTGHISLYLAIAETDTLPVGWELKVRIKMFVYNHDTNQYLTIQEANDKEWHFRDKKTEWGFKEVISLSTFNDASNGYLVDDSCIFGVEAFVVKYRGRGECVTQPLEYPLGYNSAGGENLMGWDIRSFNALIDGENCSHEFIVGGYKWILSLYPKGNGTAKGKHLSLYLKLTTDGANLPPGQKLYIKYKLLIHNHRTGVNDGREGYALFSASSNCHGFGDLFMLKDLHNNYIRSDNSIYPRGQIILISNVTDFSGNKS